MLIRPLRSSRLLPSLLIVFVTYHNDPSLPSLLSLTLSFIFSRSVFSPSRSFVQTQACKEDQSRAVFLASKKENPFRHTQMKLPCLVIQNIVVLRNFPNYKLQLLNFCFAPRSNCRVFSCFFNFGEIQHFRAHAGKIGNIFLSILCR